MDPKSDEAHFQLGALHDENKNKEKSVASMKKAIELNPKNAAALNYLGYTWAEMGVQLDEAEELIQRALKIQPNDGFYIDSLGWVYYQKGDYPKAVEQLERAVEITVDDPTIIEHLADAYEKSRQGRSRLGPLPRGAQAHPKKTIRSSASAKKSSAWRKRFDPGPRRAGVARLPRLKF